jgi:hypothetical protein
MKPFEKFLSDASSLRELLDVYLELRQHLQELGFSEDELNNPPHYSMKMMNLQDRFQSRMNYLVRQVNDYGFNVNKSEIIDYVMPLLEKINELTPLRDGNTERDNSRDKDYK